MNWRQAFIRQAQSEQQLRSHLKDTAAEYSHQLHYLQMVTEKLAKGFQAGPNDPDPPPLLHNVFARFLQTLKNQPEIRRQLGYNDRKVFATFINSLLELARRVEQLAPAATGLGQPNPEYPWRDAKTGEAFAPVDFDFRPLFSPRDAKMIKLERLIASLLQIAE
jgi:hypothetical protein